MKNNFNSNLILENARREQNEMRVFPDTDSNTDFIGFIFKYKGKALTLCEDEVNTYGEEEMFHLDKSQVGHLIDFLNRVYSEMEE